MPFEMQSHFPLGCGDDEKNLIAFIILNYFTIEIRRFGEQAVNGSSIKGVTMRSRGASYPALLEKPVFYCSVMTFMSYRCRACHTGLRSHHTPNEGTFTLCRFSSLLGVLLVTPHETIGMKSNSITDRFIRHVLHVTLYNKDSSMTY